jgi:HK97 family phage major capsid protein
MKTLKSAHHAFMMMLLVLLAAPKAIGLTLLYYAASVGRGQFSEGAPADVKALHEAMEKAFKAMQENIDKVQQTAGNALEESKKNGGTIEAKTADLLKQLGETGTKLQDDFTGLKERQLELEQKLAAKPGSLNPDLDTKSPGQLVTESEEFKRVSKDKNAKNMGAVDVGSFHRKAVVVNATGQNQPLVPSERVQGIVTPGFRRMTVRDLIPQSRTSSNLIEYARELVATNNAGPQYDTSSPTPGQEGAVKNESGITFQLQNAAVTTIATWIPASRQVLSDAQMLQSYIEGRLRYFLLLEEEDELLNGSGNNGELNGLMNQATAFSYGVTNQTALDSLLMAWLQVSLSEFELSGYVLHPLDWVNILKLKDTTGRYLFADPHNMEQPRVWGKPVVPTQSMTAGQFLAGAFDLAAEIFDREDATVRVAEQHADFFIRNLVAILAEERLALVVYRTAALVKGSVSHAG